MRSQINVENVEGETMRATRAVIRLVRSIALVMLLSTLAAPSYAAPFTAGNVVVYRVGDGVAALVNTGNAVFLDEYTPAGALVQSVALPTTTGGANHPLVASGTATSEGQLTRSADGQYLLLTGYGSTLPAASSLAASAAASVPRVVGRVKFDGSINTATALTDFSDANNPRSAASTNGTDIWVGGGTGGVRYATLGSTTSTQLSTDLANIRQVLVANSQLYISTQSGATLRIATVGGGTPTTAGQSIVNLAGIPTTIVPNGYFFATVPGGAVLYVADDTTGFGQIQKYSLVSGTWTQNGTVTAAGARGVTGTVSGSTVKLYATTGGNAATGGGSLYAFTDSTGYNGAISGSASVIASAAANQAFRGVAIAPASGVVPTATPTPTNTGPTATATPTKTATPTATPTGAPFTIGDIVVYRVGTGSDPLLSTGNPIFLDEYTSGGTLVQSIGMPTTASGPDYPLVASGTASSEGLMTRSVDGQWLMVPGYASTLPSASSLAGSAALTVPRVVGRVAADGTIDTSTALTDFADGNNPRSAASTNGSDIWVGGTTGGARYAMLGSTTSVGLSADLDNIRQIGIADGQLYVSTQAGTAIRMGAVGTGLPNTSGQTISVLSGFPLTGSPNGFFFADLDGAPGLDTLYVADTDAGLAKYSLVAGSWVPAGVVGVAADEYRGLTGVVDGTSVTLYATRSQSQLVQLVDDTGYNGTLDGTPALLATAAANQVFRGLALAPQRSGLIPPDKGTAKCEDTVTKSLSKLASCNLKCQTKEAGGAVKAKPFDATACAGDCRTKYDGATAKPLCPSCLDSGAQGAVADAASTFLSAKNAQIYCAGTAPLGGPNPGFVPPDKTTQKCEDAIAKSLTKLAACSIKCLVKQADAGLKSKPFDALACETGDKCRGKYDALGLALTGCPSCLDSVAQGTLADSLIGFLHSRSGALYCFGTQPLQ